MELVSLWDRVLYSMASHGCFQQTVHHYSVWQESKHCAFTWVKKPPPPHTHTYTHTSFVRSPHCVLISPCFHLFLASPCMCLLFCSLCPILSPAASRSGPTFNTDIQECNFIFGYQNQSITCYLSPKVAHFPINRFIGSLSGPRTSNFIRICYFLLSLSVIYRRAEIVVKGQTWALTTFRVFKLCII